MQMSSLFEAVGLFDMFLYQSTALETLFNSSFDCKVIERSVGAETAVKVAAGGDHFKQITNFGP